MQNKFYAKFFNICFLILAVTGTLYAEVTPIPAEIRTTPTGIEAVGILQYLPFIAFFLFWASWVAFILKLGSDDSKVSRGSWAESTLPGWEINPSGSSEAMGTATPFSNSSNRIKPGSKDKSFNSPTHHAA